MQIPIYEGCYVDGAADIRSSYPINLQPVHKKTGYSDGYLRTVDGVTRFGATPGRDRGGINWNGVLYRACSNKLCSIDANGNATELGDIGDNGKDVNFTFSFDRLALSSGGVLWYYQPSTGLTSVTDPDVGTVNTVLFMDGYFVVTDGTTIAVTELNNPYSVNPLKYGSAEESPDPINQLLRISGQLVAVGTLTCEFFQDIGGSLFPFQRLPNALIERGSVGANAVCLYNQTFAFVGNGVNEAPAVYLAGPGTTGKVSTREIDILLAAMSEAERTTLKIEAIVEKNQQKLLIHGPIETFVYDVSATAEFGQSIWFRLRSGNQGELPYRARNFIRAYDAWICGDIEANQTGRADGSLTSQFDVAVPFQFDTTFGFNDANGALFHSVELTHKPGAPGADAVYFHSYSDDGQTFSMPRRSQVVSPGQTLRRAIWFSCGLMRSARVLRFSGVNTVPDSFAALNANVEKLTV